MYHIASFEEQAAAGDEDMVDLVKEVKERGMLNNKTVLLNKVLQSPPAGVLRLMGIGFIRIPIFFLLKARLHYFVLMPRSSLYHEACFPSTSVPSVV